MTIHAQPINAFLADLAAKQPTPGGGAVAGLCGAVAASLARMVVSYSLGRKSLADHQPLLEDAGHRLDRARSIFLQLADEDAQAYSLVNELSRLPESDARRSRELPAATRAAIGVPLAVAAASADTARILASLCGTTNQHLRSDLAIAAVLVEATARSARWNVIVNLPGLTDEHERSANSAQADHLVSDTSRLCADVERRCA